MRKINRPFIILKPIKIGMIILQNVKKKINIFIEPIFGIMKLLICCISHVKKSNIGLNILILYHIIISKKNGITMREINGAFIIFALNNNGINAILPILKRIVTNAIISLYSIYYNIYTL